MGSFKTKARAVELLGRKQIRDSVTALAEIMKNAYDADAELLRVEFLTEDTKNPCIVICDTGVGMDEEELKNKWLVLGTPSKLENQKKKTPGGRALMGAKGIGRLAISRLGQQMWMFTKKTDTGWNVLYINWNIFENPDLYIEDIDIPAIYNVNLREIPQIIEKLRKIQLANLEHDSWSTHKNVKNRQMIRSQIKDSRPDQDLVDDFCGIIEEGVKKQGTVIFSLNLNDDWERDLDPDVAVDEDVLAVRNYNRLNSFMADFGANDSDFQVELFHNEEPLIFSSGFMDEEYDIYDLKIEGCIEHGLFKGHIDARNGNTGILKQCNEVLGKGISVTSGIRDWEDYDCGKYTVKLCHFEMDKKNTGLNEAERERVTRRIKRAGGIGVYRDNVRVLPYGEPDNDFLELEQNRSKSAKYYLFSHRNMFGRIDITSLENPHLEDKSSREGFIENQYYNYFIRTVQNLLKRIAVEFVGDMNKESFKLRKSYLDYNKKKKEEEKKVKEFEKEQERLFNKDSARVGKLLEENPSCLKKFEEDFQNRVNQLKKEKARNRLPYKALLEYDSKVKAIRYETERYIMRTQEQLHIYIDGKFESNYDVRMLEKIDVFNERLDEVIQDSKGKLSEICDRLLEDNLKIIESCHTNFEKEAGVALEDALSDLQNYIEETRSIWRQLLGETRYNLTDRYEELSKKVNLIMNYEEDILRFKGEFDETIEEDFQAIEDNLSLIESNLFNPDKPEELKETHNKINEEEERIYHIAERINEDINVRFTNLNERLDEILSRFQTDDTTLIRQLTARNNELKQLNDMYADLANLGMAAEIVSHELNQLFNNVYDAINQLRFIGVSANGKYYLNQIDIGFRAISDRMSQMSPMYRSRSMYRKKVNIYDMLEDIRRFFENRLKKQNVEFINDVPRNLELKLSLSKIYPVISNLTYNSLYWMADKKEKKILFRYDETEHALYVEDSGEGISIRNKERVFDPFFSLKKDGRGLGLTICKNVLESQGYGIEVVIKPEEKCLKGACFKITFGTEAGE